jgi:hypothetical protein
MLPWSVEMQGHFEEITFTSEVLKENPLKDPYQRPLWIYLPPGYADEPDRRYPGIYLIQGMTGQLDMWRNRSAFRKNFPELADELFAKDEAPPCILVWVDCWTSLGGSQFLDSAGTGRYHTYLCDEIVPWVDAHYRTMPEREHRGIAGKSSGGYDAMITPMLRPDLWGAWLLTLVMPFLKRATSRNFRSLYVPCATTTQARLSRSGRIFVVARLFPGLVIIPLLKFVTILCNVQLSTQSQENSLGL